MDITKIFCDFDDACQNAEKVYQNTFALRTDFTGLAI